MGSKTSNLIMSQFKEIWSGTVLTYSWPWWRIQPKWKPCSPPWSETNKLHIRSLLGLYGSSGSGDSISIHLSFCEAGLQQSVHKHRLLPLGFSVLRHRQQHRFHFWQSWTPVRKKRHRHFTFWHKHKATWHANRGHKVKKLLALQTAFKRKSLCHLSLADE